MQNNPSVRVMSANLWNGGARPAALRALAEKVAPDVIALQELAPAQAQALEKLLPHGELDPRTDRKGMGVLCRWPVDIRRIAFGPREAWSARTNVEGKLIEVLNVHIAAPHVPPPWRSFGFRRKQLETLETHFLANIHHPIIVAGDFNSPPISPFYRRMLFHLSDAAVEAALINGRKALRTWGPWAGSPRLLRIDHIFSRGFVVRSFEVIPIEGGDHSAVLAELQVAI